MALDVVDLITIHEDVAAGTDAIFEIADSSDFSHLANISKMRDALALLRMGADMPSEEAVIEDKMIAMVDELIASAGGIDDSSLNRARQLAAQYLSENMTAGARETRRNCASR